MCLIQCCLAGTYSPATSIGSLTRTSNGIQTIMTLPAGTCDIILDVLMNVDVAVAGGALLVNLVTGGGVYFAQVSFPIGTFNNYWQNQYRLTQVNCNADTLRLETTGTTYSIFAVATAIPVGSTNINIASSAATVDVDVGTSISSLPSVSLTEGGNSVTISGTSTVSIAGSSFTDGGLDTNVINVVSVVDSSTGSTSPVYPDVTPISFPSLYHSPIFGNVMPRSAHFHACVNTTGNFMTPVLFSAPNGTCGFNAAVSLSTTTSSNQAVVVGGIMLNQNILVQVSTVGTNSNQNFNTYLDQCTAQGNQIFLNTTIPDGMACIDITLAQNNGPNYATPVDSFHRGVRDEPDASYETEGIVTLADQIDHVDVVNSYTFLHDHVSALLYIYYSCSNIGDPGYTWTIAVGSGFSFKMTVTQSQPSDTIGDIPISVQAGSIFSYSTNVGDNGYCVVLFSIFDQSFTSSSSDGGFYATSYVDGPPMQWFYPLTASALKDMQYSERKRRYSMQ